MDPFSSRPISTSYYNYIEDTGGGNDRPITNRTTADVNVLDEIKRDATWQNTLDARILPLGTALDWTLATLEHPFSPRGSSWIADVNKSYTGKNDTSSTKPNHQVKHRVILYSLKVTPSLGCTNYVAEKILK